MGNAGVTFMLAGASTWIFTSCTGCEFKLAILIESVVFLPSVSRRPLFSAKLIPVVSSLLASIATERVLEALVASAKNTASSVATACAI